MRADPGWYYSQSILLTDLEVKQPLVKRTQDECTRFLIFHGCAVLEEAETYCVVVLPEGTWYSVRLPSLPTEHYRFILPDGMYLYGHDLSRFAAYSDGMKELYPDVKDLEEFLSRRIKDTRPTFRVTRESYRLSLEQVAQGAGMTCEEVTLLEETGVGTQGQIAHLVTALNNLIHTTYGLVNFSGFTCTDRPASIIKYRREATDDQR